jgi:hypothetical protein
MPPLNSAKKAQLTLGELANHDDKLTEALVDRVCTRLVWRRDANMLRFGIGPKSERIQLDTQQRDR